MRMNDRKAKRELLEIGRRMYAKNYIASNDGNLSIRVRSDEIWITPTGVSKGFIKKANLVRLRLDGTVLSQGEFAPSSEAKMHLQIYRENPDVMGVCHAHPIMSTSFAVAGVALNEPIYPEAMVNLGFVPCVHYATPGTQGVADSIAPYAKSHCAVLLANHGPVTWGRSLMEAWYRLEAVEHYAQIMFNTCYMMNKANRLSRAQIEEIAKIRQSLGIPKGVLPQGLSDAVNLSDAE